MNANDLELLRIRKNINKYVIDKLEADQKVSPILLRYVFNDPNPVEVDSIDADYELDQLRTNDPDFTFLNNGNFNRDISKSGKWLHYFSKKEEIRQKGLRNIDELLRDDD